MEACPYGEQFDDRISFLPPRSATSRHPPGQDATSDRHGGLGQAPGPVRYGPPSPVVFGIRISPHLPLSGFRRNERESRAGKKAFPATSGGEKMERTIRVGSARSTIHGSGNAVFPSSGRGGPGKGSPPDLHQSELRRENSIKRPKQFNKYR